MNRRLNIILISTTLFLTFVQFGCSGFYDAFVNLRRLEFKLGSVNNFSLAGVNISKIGNKNDFNVVDAAKLVNSFTRGEFPATFTLNVLAKNPNDGTGGTKNTTAILKSLTWRLMIDDKETINGNISRSIEIPGVGQETTIPILMSLDLIKFFKEQGYENVLNLALALGGVSGSSARLKLVATPTVETIFGPIIYPGELTIVDKEFRSE